jgi:hypothetical protein
MSSAQARSETAIGPPHYGAPGVIANEATYSPYVPAFASGS